MICRSSSSFFTVTCHMFKWSRAFRFRISVVLSNKRVRWSLPLNHSVHHCCNVQFFWMSECMSYRFPSSHFNVVRVWWSISNYSDTSWWHFCSTQLILYIRLQHHVAFNLIYNPNFITLTRRAPDFCFNNFFCCVVPGKRLSGTTF